MVNGLPHGTGQTELGGWELILSPEFPTNCELCVSNQRGAPLDLAVESPSSLRSLSTRGLLSPALQPAPSCTCRLLASAGLLEWLATLNQNKGLHRIPSGSPSTQRPATLWEPKWDEAKPGHGRLAGQPVPRSMLTIPSHL